MKRILILASGNGSNAVELIKQGREQGLFRVDVVICDKPEAKVIEKARALDVPVEIVAKLSGETRHQHEARILKVIDQRQFDLIVLAGYERLLSANFIAHFSPRSIVNIHPSLLPEYAGLNAYDRAYHNGKRSHGITIHFVDEGMDTGEIITQREYHCPVNATLEEFKTTGLKLEHQTYATAIGELFKKKWQYRIEVYPQDISMLEKQDHLVSKVYWLELDRPIPHLAKIVNEVIADQAVETAFVNGHPKLAETLNSLGFFHITGQEVRYLPGVTDNAATACGEALKIHPELAQANLRVSSGHLHFIKHSDDKPTCNDWLQQIRVFTPENLITSQRFWTDRPATVKLNPAKVHQIDLEVSNERLLQLNDENLWALRLEELHFVREHYKTLKRSPTDVEMEIIAQTWSEHCKHKIFAAEIDYQDEEGSQIVKGLFKTYIKGATEKIARERKLSWLRSVFTDNAGIVRFDKKIDVCIKVETHNSPSALDPYGGALTGILGVNRDILGCGMGARPVANTNVFCLPPLEADRDGKSPWPKKLIRPKAMREGVHRGVKDGGNKSGIPTVNGAFHYDMGYAGKPLVYCGTVGVLPHEVAGGPSHEKRAQNGDYVVMCGGRIGKDGIHGATFSSLGLTEGIPSTVVQIGDPLTQKRLTDFLLVARDLGLYSAVTDNGAGGLSSSIGEMSQFTGGARIDLSLAPVKYPGLSAAELMISESQERMSLAVPSQHWNKLEKLAKQYGVEITRLGEFNNSGYLHVFMGSEEVAKLSLAFLHDDLPPMKLSAKWDKNYQWNDWYRPLVAQKLTDVSSSLRALLASPNIRSHESWVRQYDHEVQAASVTKPFSPKGAPSDAGVIALSVHGGEEKTALAISSGLAPQVARQDGKLMAIYSIDEAVRNAVCTGADPKMMVLVDNFCWPDPLEGKNNPDFSHKLAQLVRTNQGLYETALAYGMPFVSGKDSMKNDATVEWQGHATKISVLPTLLVTAMAAIHDVTKVVRQVLTNKQDIWLLGDNTDNFAATLTYLRGENKVAWPAANLAQNMKNYEIFHEAVQSSLISGAHDVSEGGMLVTIAEMCMHLNVGATLHLADLTEARLFGEGTGQLIFATDPKDKTTIQSLFRDCPLTWLGQSGGEMLAIEAGHEKQVFTIDALRSWYQGE